MDLTAVKFEVDRLLAEVEDPRRRAILANYRRHVLLEMSGRWPEILGPEMTVGHPVYRIIVGGVTSVYDGMEEVAGFYRGMAEAGMTVSSPIEEKIAVADWGLAFESTSLQVLPGRAFAALGLEVEDPDAVYRFTISSAGIWTYDENARLVGEHIYTDMATARFEPGDPAEVISQERAAELLAPLLEN